jgi:mannose-6-phosphate isomerase-like protein (cupin superfamily)
MGALADGGVVQLPGEARTIDVGGFTVVVHAAAGMTSGAFSLTETVEAIAGSGPPLHVHRDAAESFYVIDGEYVMHLEGHDFRCSAGSFVYVPTACRTHSERPPWVAAN